MWKWNWCFMKGARGRRAGWTAQNEAFRDQKRTFSPNTPPGQPLGWQLPEANIKPQELPFWGFSKHTETHVLLLKGQASSVSPVIEWEVWREDSTAQQLQQTEPSEGHWDRCLVPLVLSFLTSESRPRWMREAVIAVRAWSCHLLSSSRKALVRRPAQLRACEATMRAKGWLPSCSHRETAVTADTWVQETPSSSWGHLVNTCLKHHLMPLGKNHPHLRVDYLRLHGTWGSGWNFSCDKAQTTGIHHREAYPTCRLSTRAGGDQRALLACGWSHTTKPMALKIPAFRFQEIEDINQPSRGTYNNLQFTLLTSF